MTSPERKVVARASAPAVEKAADKPPDEPKGPKRISTTLGAYGAKLPVGILDTNGVLHKEIVTKTWKTRDEIAMGKKLPPDAGMAEHVSVVVANMCSRLGPYDLEPIDDAQRSLILSRMYMADVFYAYAWLRRSTMGERLKLKITCPRAGCGVEFPYTGNLDSVEVNVVENIDDILWQYRLEKPISLRGTTVSHFQCAYPKWEVMSQAKQGSAEAEVIAMTIRASIIGINDQRDAVSLTMSEIEELSKIDFEGLQDGINTHFLGPKMGIEGTCSPAVCEKFRRGGFKFTFPINWRYQDFFAHSSR